MIVTIDGPAGAGKSTTAKALACRLGFRFLDTGAMYRAVAWAAQQRGLPWDQPQALVELAGNLKLDVSADQVLVNGVDATRAIRTQEITAVTHYAANNPGVRAILVEQQRRMAGDDNIVTEGRDQGTVVFPHAECKIFLTASAEERARRRAVELTRRGETVDVAVVLADQQRRDTSDRSRSVGPLAAADDAIEFITDGLSPEQVIDGLEDLVRQRMGADIDPQLAR
jgi:cytidylate kinase/pantoate ligase/cytidylate kinase